MTIRILNGVHEVFDEWLGLAGQTKYGSRPGVPKYVPRQAAIDLSQSGGPLENKHRTITTPSQMISEAMGRLGSNLQQLDVRRPARSNWEWTKSCHLTSHNDSPEKQLEKYVTFFLDDRWINQIPVCNGLGQGANACRIDLAFRVDAAEYELIELKYGPGEEAPGSNHPLYAAMELLNYGLLYLLFREQDLLGVPSGPKHHLLQAEHIHLVVLAPVEWYCFRTRTEATNAFKFDWLERALTDGLRAYVSGRSLGTFKMDFRFEAISEVFATAYRPLTTAISRFRELNMSERTSVYASHLPRG